MAIANATVLTAQGIGAAKPDLRVYRAACQELP